MINFFSIKNLNPLTRKLLFSGFFGACLFTLCSYGVGSMPLENTIIDTLNLTWFSYGHGYVLAEILFWISISLIIFCWTSLGFLLRTNDITYKNLFPICIYWIIPLTFALPMYSRDVYSYLAQGSMSNHGFNPYAEGPVVIPGSIFDNVSNLWSTTTTPYGPLHIFFMKIITYITSDDIFSALILLKLLSLPFLGLLFYCLIKISEYFAVKKTQAIWLGLLNPLILLHLFVGMHNEIFYIPIMLYGILLAINKKCVPALILIGLTASIKIISIVPAAFIFWIWYRNRVGNHLYLANKEKLKKIILPLCSSVFIPSVIIIILTIILGDGFGWISASSGSNYIINWLSLPTLISHIIVFLVKPFHLLYLTSVLALVRKIALILMTLGLIITWIKFRKSTRDAIYGIIVSYLLIVLLYPAALPWYYSWFFPLIAATISKDRIIITVTMVSIFILLIFLPSGAIGLYSLFNVLFIALISVIAETNSQTGLLLNYSSLGKKYANR